MEEKESEGRRGGEVPFIHTSYPVCSHCRQRHIVLLGLVCRYYYILLLHAYIHTYIAGVG